MFRVATDTHQHHPALRPAEADAMRDVWPMLLNIVPYGVLIGVTIDRIGLPPGLGLGSAALIFSGSAHLAALTLLGAGAGPLTVLAAVVLVNARLALYGAALQPYFRPQRAWFRWLAPHLLLDQTYALVTRRTDLDDPVRFRRYWLTLGTVIAVVWLSSHVVGLLLGPLLPAHTPLDITAPALLVGLLVPHLVQRPAIAAAAASLAVTAAATFALPAGAALLAGIVAGLATGALTDRGHGRARAREER